MMTNKIVLAFDMDNTVCDTNGEVLKRLKEYCLEVGNKRGLELIEQWKGVSVSYWEGEVMEIVHKEVIEKRVYMDTAKPTELVGECGELVNLLKRLKEEIEGLRVVVCTHRGDNKEAWMSTYNYLKAIGLLDCFDMIHSISHVVNKNKIEFLKGHYKGSKILLVDDNPFGSRSGSFGYCEEVLIYSGIDNFDSYKNQDHFNGHEDLFERVMALV